MRLLLLSLLAATQLAGCGYNTFQTQDEQITAAWSEVVNQYQRRADLIPNLVNTVKGYAAAGARRADRRDRGSLEGRQHPGDTRARQRPEGVPAIPGRAGRAVGALSRLMVVVEPYPELKSDANFRDLQAQLEGTENRITVARNRYIKAVQEYNVTVRRFPTQPYGDGFRPRREAALHRRERSGDRAAAACASTALNN